MVAPRISGKINSIGQDVQYGKRLDAKVYMFTGGTCGDFQLWASCQNAASRGRDLVSVPDDDHANRKLTERIYR